MTELSHAELSASLGNGLLTFPVTHFDDQLRFDERRYRDHLEWQLGFELAGIFVAGGTGEGFSLSREETARVVSVGVEQAAGRLPVIAPATGATVTARAQATDAQALGADGVLLLPPYLTEGTQAGLRAHVEAVLEATDLGVIVYNRANAVYTAETIEYLADRHENLIGFKDGIGDIEAMARLYARLGDRLIYIGGLPTAETYALPLLELGFTTYSSAVCNFVPHFAVDFYHAVRSADRGRVYTLLNEFVLPYLEIRDRAAGYGVSIIKAGLDAVGREGGPVRPPLQPLTDQDRHDLSQLLLTSRLAPAAA